MTCYSPSGTHGSGQPGTQRSEWRWGDAKKRREVVTRFGQTSSIHAASYVCSPRRKSYSLFVKIVYRTLFAFCVLSVISAIFFLLQDNFSKESTFINTVLRDSETGLKEDPIYFPLFPRVTICRRPTYRTDFNESYMELVHYAMLSLGTGQGPYIPSEEAMLVQIAMYEMNLIANLSADEINMRDTLQTMEERFKNLSQSETFNLTRFVLQHSVGCRGMFRSCLIHVHLPDCCELFEPVLTTYGVCFTTRTDSPIQKYASKTGARDVIVKFNLISPDQTEAATEVGFRVFFSDPYMDVPVMPTTGEVVREDMVTGMKTAIKVQLIKTDRTALFTPFHGMGNSCPKWEYTPTFQSIRFSTYLCHLKFLNELMRRRCKCNLIYRYSDVEDMSVCGPRENYQCFFHAVFESNVSVLPCKFACVVYSYKTESSYMSLGGNSSTSGLEILYNTQQYTYNEYKKATLSYLLMSPGCGTNSRQSQPPKYNLIAKDIRQKLSNSVPQLA
ncbi:hypothetical protein JTE90_008513 [Oedothorax gibbosus]|uniref:Sodium channel protein Nach n=1 Tax=Oedothorax gibbosus TaxID=931172 RepID=A0AAV6V0Q2_9ARAC|nr:hypothetical protein JTE90_008513 [Oedothorax gibbosus]